MPKAPLRQKLNIAPAMTPEDNQQTTIGACDHVNFVPVQESAINKQVNETRKDTLPTMSSL